MGKIILSAVLSLIVSELILVAQATGEETCQFDPQIEKQCGHHTYKTVKPLLDYFRQVRNELEQSETKELQLTELNSNLMEKYHEIARIHEKVMREANLIDDYKTKILLQDIELQKYKKKVRKLESKIISQQKTVAKCEDELLTTKLQLQQNHTELLKKEKEQELCQIEVHKLHRAAHNNHFPSSCIPFGKDPGVHQIKVSDLEPFDVLCDSQSAGPGWIVMQQRIGGERNFNRSWGSYRDGFGSLESDFFLGLEKIHHLTRSRHHELYVHSVHLLNTTYFGRYDNFSISDEEHGYALSLGEFTGDDEIAIRDNEHMKFSTFDRDNDFDAYNNCANAFEFGWWFSRCSYYNRMVRLRELFYHSKEIKLLIRPKS